MNYFVTTEWKSLSEIMDSDYDSSKQYRVHSNLATSGKLCYTVEGEPTPAESRSVADDYCDIYFNVGDNPYLKTNGVDGGMYVDVTEVV